MFNNFGGHFGKMGYIQPGISGRGGGRKWLETLTLLELADECHALITKWRKLKPIWSHRNLNPNYPFLTKGSFLLLILADRPACVLTRYHIITQSPHSRFFPLSAIKSPSCIYHTAIIPRGWQVSGVTFRATYWEETVGHDANDALTGITFLNMETVITVASVKRIMWPKAEQNGLRKTGSLQTAFKLYRL